MSDWSYYIKCTAAPHGVVLIQPYRDKFITYLSIEDKIRF